MEPKPPVGTDVLTMPPNQKTVWLEMKADGKTLSGEFTFKRLTIGEIAKLGADVARRNGGLTVDDTTDTINTMLAHFSRAIVKAPEWWNPEEVYELDVLRVVYKALMEFEKTFRRPAPEQGAGAPTAG